MVRRNPLYVHQSVVRKIEALCGKCEELQNSRLAYDADVNRRIGDELASAKNSILRALRIAENPL